jgi:hypothetical protein
VVDAQKFGGPSAWTRADYENNEDWVVQLSRTEADELLAACEQVRAKGLKAFHFGKDEFPLPTLSKTLNRVLEELEQGRGFCMLRGIPLDELPDNEDETLYALYWGLGEHLGYSITQNRRGQRIAEVTDSGDKYTPNVRGYSTTARLYPHSDASDVVGLLCIQPAKAGGESCIASGIAIHDHLVDAHPDYLDVLYRGFRHSMRGEGVTGDLNEVTNNTIPVFSLFEGILSCHMNRRLIVEGADKMGVALTDHELEVLDYVNDMALDAQFRFDMDFQRGDIQLLNNHIIVHSRQSFEDHEERHKKRRLLRLWKTIPHGRPLAPEYADRTNGGPRGGMRVAPEFL